MKTGSLSHIVNNLEKLLALPNMDVLIDAKIIAAWRETIETHRYWRTKMDFRYPDPEEWPEDDKQYERAKIDELWPVVERELDRLFADRLATIGKPNQWKNMRVNSVKVP